MRKPVWSFSDERYTVTAFVHKGGHREIEFRDHQNNQTAELSERNARFLFNHMWEMSGLTRMVAQQHRHDFQPALTPEKRAGEQPTSGKKQGEDIDRQQSASPAGMKNEDNHRKR